MKKLSKIKPPFVVTYFNYNFLEIFCKSINFHIFQIEQPMMTAIMQTPTAQIPLNIPYPMPIHNLNLVQPPPLPQLRPYGLEPAPQQQQQQVTTQIINHHMTSSIQHAPAQPPFIPPWIKSRLGTIHILRQHIFGLFLTHPLTMSAWLQY